MNILCGMPPQSRYLNPFSANLIYSVSSGDFLVFSISFDPGLSSISAYMINISLDGQNISECPTLHERGLDG